MSGKRSILLFGEGKTEWVFLNQLRRLYRQPDVITPVEFGKGGSPRTVVEAAIKTSKLGDYDGTLILLDADRDASDIPDNWAAKHGFSIKLSRPCIEATMLDILEDPSVQKLRKGARASECCKTHFEKKWLGTDRGTRIIPRMKKVLPEKLTVSVLDQARQRIPVLDEIIHAIQTGTL